MRGERREPTFLSRCPRFIRYEKSGPWSGMVIVVVDGAAIMGATTAAFASTRGAGAFTDGAGLASGLAAYAGNAARVLFAMALLDTSVIGAFAVSLSTSYALGDVLGLNHSPHRSIKQAQRPAPSAHRPPAAQALSGVRAPRAFVGNVH